MNGNFIFKYNYLIHTFDQSIGLNTTKNIIINYYKSFELLLDKDGKLNDLEMKNYNKI